MYYFGQEVKLSEFSVGGLIPNIVKEPLKNHLLFVK